MANASDDIDVELMTAGEYKRTLTMLGENTDKGRGLGPAPAAASPHAHEGLAPGARSRPR